MRRTLIFSGIVMLLAVVALWYYSKDQKKEKIMQLYTEVKRGKFEILVTVTGELQAEHSVRIMAPTELRSRNLRFSQIKIQDLIPEGTVVDSGDYVALLDRSDASNRLKDMLDELEQDQSNLMKTRLDTTMQLRGLRDQLINLQYAVEEAQIILEQSKFEPPATIRQAKINLDKAERALDQARKNYFLKVKQAEADMKEAEFNLKKQQRRVQEMENVISKFEIHAPGSGMIIYEKEWGGEKRKVGSMISPWDLTVATLPDMSSMISKTYVNEIDISKVEKGQMVRIGVDAFPEKKYTGVVYEVANIGEQLPNTDAKVFEVSIKVDGSDPILRPAMTTSNQIITASFDSALFIPLESVFVEDSIPYVYKKSGLKQVVLLGPENENEVIVEKGLKEGEKILLNLPDNSEKYSLAGEELIPVIKERTRQKKLKEEKRKRDEEMKRTARKNARNIQVQRGSQDTPSSGGSRSDVIKKEK
ncbi:MAG TPA: HlyD family efflux transporter periplasmic adaptor subunit [Bacteroidetes bacterium]|nr:HlyD family efflux transporter periplasmic adaptor subunit [Bacteroidota bacterium]